MSDYKLVPVEPTAEMIEAAQDAYMPFGDMDLAIRMAVLAAPAVQGEPVAWATRLYNTAYHAGHHDTVEGDYTHVYPQDMDIHHEDVVQEWLADNPQPAEQQPELAKYQPCGCVICTCEHETQCQGCGGHHCGTHPVGQFSAPAYLQTAEQQAVSHDWDDQDKCRRCGDRDWYASATCSPKQQPAPDVSALVEALVAILEHDSPINIVDTATATERDIFDIARAALAAHRKQGDQS